ncbi:beta-propeller fold lactonase family protein [Pontiellaceae bacterium B12219]|nr:beta-propeller fold lactonase family protein [Pontiellaceae bacterium B12219]
MKYISSIYVLLFAALSTIAQTYLSPNKVALSQDGKTVYLTAETANQLLSFDLSTKKVSQTVPLPGSPSGMTVQENALLITGGGHLGRVWKIQAGKISDEIKTGHTPMSPVLSPDGKTLYVCNRFNNDVSFIDLETGETRARIPVIREPVAADLSKDGKFLFVANHIPDGRADVDYVAAKISVINTKTKEVKTIPLVNGAEGLRGLKISPDGKTVFATHLMARFLVPTTQLERGWVSTDALSVIDVATQTLQYTVLLDDLDQGFPNPWAIGFSNGGKTLVVSSAGNHEISLIDLPALTKKIEAEATASTSAAHLNAHNNLSFLSGIRKRVKLQGNGPRSLAVDGEFIFIGNYFSDALEVVRVSSDWNTRSGLFPLGKEQPITMARQGELYFNDAGLCFQNWLSCATCHPDARTDAMNWDLLNDGMGNPKNVKTMLLAHETPRAMWLGVRDDAYAGVRAGLRHIQFSVRPEIDAQAIDAYLKSLKPVPSPYLENGELSRAALRGKTIFDSIGCAHCHPAPLFTDLKMYDLGTTTGPDEGLPVDVPHLVEVWRTAPYMHDGRAATMLDVFTVHKHGNKHGAIDGLTTEQLNDLVEYVLSL